ncbi:HBS1-like protein isoform X3 [Diaphorina citri]|uniref:HBS1-like protein isoform X1 n=1 Tax=Diaphorina citri TaxID=121845 RepID=A0A1S4EPW6_DIACI|nr:HBS1-like protein isoform X2 [Diaphorina citri]XP_017304220.1 HBS1-like protein isoform X1 [Diaphorina citri]XP_017304221.1 HBS1-like protein isoform X3 [Diaphorina citri]
MSRHRNVRSLRYSDEYDYDDVYGHSVEDDHSISPTDESFLFDRSKTTQIASFLGTSVEEEPEEEEEDNPPVIESPPHPVLSDLEEAQLQSCLDKIRDIVGDSVPDSVVVDTVIRNQFDVDRSLDQILNSGSSGSVPVDAPKPQRVRKLQTANTDANVKTDVSSNPSASAADQSFPDTSGFAVPECIPTKTPTQKKLGPSSSTPVTPRSQSPSTPVSRSRSPATPTCTSPTPDQEPSRSVKDKLKKIEEYTREQAGGKGRLHLVVIGHVDAGKSTLMGHLLYLMGRVSAREIHKHETESKKLGKQSFMYAWILDETGEERNRGITMDVGQSQFETKTKYITLLDAPGHKDFIPNMITGATQADVALLVVDATRGEFETGFESGGQTREHALLVRSLGVNQLGVVINKLDTVSWSQDRFQEIVTKLGAFLKQAGFRDSDIEYVPCSGLTGENLTTPSQVPALTSWYSGPCLLDVIDNFKTPSRPLTKPLRMSVSDIYKSTGSGYCIAGRVETGVILAGEKVMVQPQNEVTTVKAVYVDEMSVSAAYAGDNVSVTLLNYDQQNVSVGFLLSELSHPCPVSSKFEARIVVFNITTPITIGYPVNISFMN